jgi:hypothetical protein
VVQVSDLARPVMAALTDHCPRCKPAVSAKPVAQLVRGVKAVFVYECPVCLHSWWSTRDTAVYAGWIPEVAA